MKKTIFLGESIIAVINYSLDHNVPTSEYEAFCEIEKAGKGNRSEELYLAMKSKLYKRNPRIGTIDIINTEPIDLTGITTKLTLPTGSLFSLNEAIEEIKNEDVKETMQEYCEWKWDV